MRSKATGFSALVLALAATGCSPSTPEQPDAANPASTDTAAIARPVRPVGAMGPDCGTLQAPELKGLVSDPANQIPDADELLLEQGLRQYQAATGHEAVAVLLPTLAGQDDGLVARCLGDAWSIGDETRNDGVMILLVPSEEKVRVAMGLGFGSLEQSNAKAQQVIDAMMPSLSQGNMVGGLKAGVQALPRILP